MKNDQFREDAGYLDDGDYLDENDDLEEAPAPGDWEPDDDNPGDPVDSAFDEDDSDDDGWADSDAAFDPDEDYPDDIQDEDDTGDTQDEYYHESLETPEAREELTGDDSAMYAAGVTHPEDAAFHIPDDDPSVQDGDFPDETEYAGEPENTADDLSDGQENAPRHVRRRTRAARKGRPRRKKGSGLLSIPHMLAAAIWLLVILAIGVSLGRMIWVCAADVLAFGRESKEVTVSVTSDDTMESIAQKLQDAGLIRYKKLFLLYADLSHAERKMTTGTFTLNTLYDYNALVKQMSPRSGNRAVVEDVLIPEGYSCRQIFERLEEKGVCKAADLEQWAANGELGDYWFLSDVTRGDKYCLEGYLFPATYDFYENSTPKQVLTKMLDAFQANFTEELKAQLPALNERVSQMMRDDGKSEDFIAQNQITLHQLITVASLIEKETASHEESPKIASVIYNRLFRWGDTPRYLNIDASVIYALNGKTGLTAEDMAVDSPYNTYTHTGLTPGPISNPGIASMKAALNPEDTDFYYYVLNPETGTHEFTKTYEEHQALVEKFKNAENG